MRRSLGPELCKSSAKAAKERFAGEETQVHKGSKSIA
jgi:hypothetical protein